MCLVIAQIQVMAFMNVFSVHPEALIRRQHIYTIATVMHTPCYKYAITQIIHARDSLTYIHYIIMVIYMLGRWNRDPFTSSMYDTSRRYLCSYL